MSVGRESPYVLWSKPADEILVVALHGRGATEQDFAGLATRLPAGHTVASVRGPIPEGTGYAWFANRGIGRPQPESLRAHTAELLSWLDGVSADIPVFYGHSADDTVIPADLIERSRTWLRQKSGAILTEPAYDGFGHGISVEELIDIRDFLDRI